MKIIETISEMQNICKELKKSKTIGFVPTMGYLHEGHLSLAEKSKHECNVTVVSIYVNPTQFGQGEDLDKYPRNWERDKSLLEKLNIDYLFFPDNQQMYPDNYKTYVTVEEISSILCGKSRPVHFKGVATIVNKLVNIVQPDFMYMGEKDFQQIVVLENMLRDLNLPAKIVRCSIIRETDGLAMSSRNSYLNSEERARALCLYNSIMKAKELYRSGKTDPLFIREEMQKIIDSAQGITDYIEFVNQNNLKSVETINDATRVIIAVKIGKTRLIDNMNIYG